MLGATRCLALLAQRLGRRYRQQPHQALPSTAAATATACSLWLKASSSSSGGSSSPWLKASRQGESRCPGGTSPPGDLQLAQPMCQPPGHLHQHHHRQQKASAAIAAQRSSIPAGPQPATAATATTCGVSPAPCVVAEAVRRQQQASGLRQRQQAPSGRQQQQPPPRQQRREAAAAPGGKQQQAPGGRQQVARQQQASGWQQQQPPPRQQRREAAAAPGGKQQQAPGGRQQAAQQQQASGWQQQQPPPRQQRREAAAAPGQQAPGGPQQAAQQQASGWQQQQPPPRQQRREAAAVPGGKQQQAPGGRQQAARQQQASGRQHQQGMPPPRQQRAARQQQAPGRQQQQGAPPPRQQRQRKPPPRQQQRQRQQAADLVKLLHAAANQHGPWPPPPPPHEVERLLQLAQQRSMLQEMDPRQVADLMWAVGNLQAPSHQGRFSELQSQCVDLLDAAATAAAAIGTGKVAGGGRPLTQPLLWRMEPVRLVGVLDGYARALPPGRLPPSGFRAATAEALLKAAAAASATAGGPVSSAAAAAAASRPASSAAAADGKSYRSAAATTTRSAAAVSRPAPGGTRLKARQWSQAVRSCAAMLWGDAPVVPMAAAFVSRLGDPDVRAQHIANVVWGLGTVAELRPSTRQQQQEQLMGAELHPITQQQQQRKHPTVAELHPSTQQQQQRQRKHPTVAELRPSTQQQQEEQQPDQVQQAEQAVSALLSAFLDELQHDDAATGDKVMPQHLSTLLVGVAKLALPRADAQLEPMLTQLLHALYHRLPSASPQCVANTLWALAKLAERGVDVAGAMEGALQEEPLQDLLPELLRAFEAQLPRVKPQEVSNTLWALAGLAGAGVDVQPALEGRVLPSLLAALRSKLTCAAPQAISNSLWALTGLAEAGVDVQPALEGQVLPSLLAGLERKLRLATPQAVSNTLLALAELSYCSNPDPQQLQPLVDAFAAKLQRASGQELCNVVSALGTLRMRPDEPLAAELLRSALALGGWRQRLDHQPLQLQLRGISQLQPQLQLHGMSKQPSQLQPHGISQLLLGAAELRLPLQSGRRPWPLADLQQLVQPLLFQTSSGNPFRQARLDAAYAIVCELCDCPSELSAAKPIVQQLLHTATESHESQPDGFFFRQLFQIHLAYDLLAGCDSLLLPDLLPVCEQVWRRHTASAASGPCSAFQADVIATAQRLQEGSAPFFRPDSVKHGGHALVGDELFAAAALAEPSEGLARRQVVIEAAGRLCFMRNQPRLETGSAVLRHRLLRSLPTDSAFAQPAVVVVVPFFEWDALQSPAAKQQYLRGLVAASLQLDA